MNGNPKSRFALDDDSVTVVIGSGAGGAVLANELCRGGFRVVLLEAGRRLSVQDYRNDEFFAFEQLTWQNKRSTSGNWSVARTSPTLPAYTGKAVGGTTNHWGALAFRIQDHELRARGEYGEVRGAALTDWPITAQELEPYWVQAEAKMGVTGTGDNPLLPVTNNFRVLYAGAKRSGYQRIRNDRHAINSRPRDGRPACIQLGFCGQGCKAAAKWSTLYTEIPSAERTGRLDLRSNCTAIRIEHDASGRASGVVYADELGRLHFQKAAVVALAANAIETPRLLLNSSSGKFPAGLANGSGMVGRFYMKHLNATVWGLFDRPVHMNRGVTMGGTVYDESALDDSRGFVGGYLMQAVQIGIPILTAVVMPHGWGRHFTSFIENYDHLSGIWLNGEDLPRHSNRVTLSDSATDWLGLPVAHLHVDEHPNDHAMRAHFYERAEMIMAAAGAKDTLRGIPLPASHNMGTCRMSRCAGDGVTNPYGRTHEIPNLFVTDGSLFPTSTAENPTLTIVALAIRQAEYILRELG